VPDVRDPVCGMEFPEEEAEALGASVVVRQGRKHYFCSPACAREFEAGAGKEP
jgi:YHS domain-containing protein